MFKRCSLRGDCSPKLSGPKAPLVEQSANFTIPFRKCKPSLRNSVQPTLFIPKTFRKKRGQTSPFARKWLPLRHETRGCGVIGSRARLRIWCRKACRFKSCHPYQQCTHVPVHTHTSAHTRGRPTGEKPARVLSCRGRSDRDRTYIRPNRYDHEHSKTATTPYRNFSDYVPKKQCNFSDYNPRSYTFPLLVFHLV